jgi:hypothetical protein
MLGLHKLHFTVLSLFILSSAALAACGDDTDTTASNAASGATTATTGATTGGGTGGEGTGGGGGAGGAGCTGMPEVPAKTIKGMVQFAGTVGDTDVLRIAAFKDGMPGGIPAGLHNSMMKPAFPYAYEVTVNLPPEGTAKYGVLAYLDVGGDNPMGPDMMEDKLSMPSPLVTVTECEGANMDDIMIAP